MKRKVHAVYVALAIVSLLLAGVSYVSAQEVNDQLAAPAKAAKETKTKQEKTLSPEQQERFINLIRNAYDRLDAAVTRLENISMRLSERIEFYNTQGVDTAEALAFLSDAQNKIAEAKQMIVEGKANAEASIISDNPRERFKQARDQFRNIRQSVRDAYIFLRSALAALNDAVIEAGLQPNAINKGKATTPDPFAQPVTN